MKKHLFPREIIEYTSQYHIWKNTVRSQVLYSSVVLAVILGLLLLPYLYVDVSVSSSGIIRPVVEKNTVASLVSGKIQSLYVYENKKVFRGDIIAIVESSELRSKLSLNQKQQHKLQTRINDLKLLVSLDSAATFTPHLSIRLKSSVYRKSFIHFRKELLNDLQQIRNKTRLFKQNEYLYHKKAVSKSHYQTSLYEQSLARNAYYVHFSEQESQWQLKLTQDQQELDKLKSSHNELLSQMKRYTIRAPVTGTIQMIAGLSPGSLIYPNQKLAEISPDTGLIAECYVAPKDIGLLRKKMTGRFQIDAFDYNQWGTVNGHIATISKDISMMNNQPVFKVRCILDQSFLTLPNGFRGYIKKGMTLRGRFIVTRRSLFQLLYDRVDDWLNPVWNRTRDNPTSNTS